MDALLLLSLQQEITVVPGAPPSPAALRGFLQLLFAPSGGSQAVLSDLISAALPEGRAALQASIVEKVLCTMLLFRPFLCRVCVIRSAHFRSPRRTFSFLPCCGPPCSHDGFFLSFLRSSHWPLMRPTATSALCGATWTQLPPAVTPASSPLAAPQLPLPVPMRLELPAVRQVMEQRAQWRGLRATERRVHSGALMERLMLCLLVTAL